MWASDLPAPKPGTRRVFLCRHGETEFNRSHILQGGGVDSPLTTKGERQARALGKALALAKINCSMIVSSNQHRSIRTASIVQSVLNHHHSLSLSKAKPQQQRHMTTPRVDRMELAAFQELHCGALEGSPLGSIRDELKHVSNAWNEGNLSIPVAMGGESPLDVVCRVKEGLKDVLDLGDKRGDVVIIAHSNLNKILIAHTESDVVRRKIFSVKQGNACINVVDMESQDPHKMHIVRTNIVSHLTDKSSL